jgi:hypothetical protein
MNIDINVSAAARVPTLRGGGVLPLEVDGVRVYALSDGRRVFHARDALFAVFDEPGCLAARYLLMVSFAAKAPSGDEVLVCEVITFLRACELEAQDRPFGLAARILRALPRVGMDTLVASALRAADQQ